MYEFHPYYTNDGSVGLFSPDFNDIYHSASGALTEAYEKFILPVDIDKLMQKDSVKILDICYGIGYNSKSFLNLIFEKYFFKNLVMQKKSIAQIYTDNIISIKDKLCDILSIYIGAIRNDNNLPEISIHAVDNDKILTYLSPFIKTGVKDFKNKNIDFNYEKIHRYLKSSPCKKISKINEEINFLILDKICQDIPDIFNNEEFLSILNNPKFSPYFDSKIRGIYRYYKNLVGKTSSRHSFFTFLHNIYYQHISNCYKSILKRYQLQDVDFQLNNVDARDFIKNNDNLYDLIFLDAFTPSKCPCLWTYDFFQKLFYHLESDGILLTYSTSASIRSAMKEVGFHIGYIYNQKENKYVGTIAAKNSTLIKYPLSEYDLGLLKTTAGIFYRDEDLTALNEAIIEQRKNDIKYSDRISTSQFKKKFNRSKNNEV